MKLANYIMEQDISPISVNDIEITRLFAEMDVASSLIDCYAKHALICEYSTCDPSEFGVFMEAHMDALPGELSANKTDKVEKVHKGFGATLKRWWRSFIDLIKRLIGGIKKTFTATTIKTLIEMVEKAPEGTEYTIPAKEGNPATDIHLPVKYDVNNYWLKRENKVNLQRELGLEQNADTPLIGVVSRLTDQKGLDLICTIFEELMCEIAETNKRNS